MEAELLHGVTKNKNEKNNKKSRAIRRDRCKYLRALFVYCNPVTTVNKQNQFEFMSGLRLYWWIKKLPGKGDNANIKAINGL